MTEKQDSTCMAHSGFVVRLKDVETRLSDCNHRLIKLSGRPNWFVAMVIAALVSTTTFFGTRWVSDYEQLQRIGIVQQAVLLRLLALDAGDVRLDARIDALEKRERGIR